MVLAGPQLRDNFVNKVNGLQPATAQHFRQTAALEWGFEGFRKPMPVGSTSKLSEYAKRVVVNLIKPSKYFLKK